MDYEGKRAWNSQNRNKLLMDFKKRIGYKVKDCNIATETVILYVDELDANSMPSDININIQERVAVHYYGYDDWVAYAITDIEQKWLLATAILHNGRLI